MFSIVWRSARELRKGRLNCLKMKPRAPQNEAKMGPGGLPKGLLADLGRPGPRLGPFWCAPGCSWAPLGALLAALGAVLGPLGLLLGPPEQLLGLILASRGALFGAFGVPVFEYPWKKRKPCFLLTVHHFLRFFELPGGKKTSKKPFGGRTREILRFGCVFRRQSSAKPRLLEVPERKTL